MAKWTLERQRRANRESMRRRRASDPEIRRRQYAATKAWIVANRDHWNAYQRARPNRAEYSAWSMAKQRCGNPRHPRFADWGGRGIRVCDEWLHDFPAFLAHIGPRPGPEFSLDRIDNDGDYEPGNVRWATRVEQRRNRRLNRTKVLFVEV